MGGQLCAALLRTSLSGAGNERTAEGSRDHSVGSWGRVRRATGGEPDGRASEAPDRPRLHKG